MTKSAAPKKIKVSPQRQYVIDRMKGGGRIMVTYQDGFLPTFGFHDGGDCNQGVVERMIKNKMLIPADQGLIADMPQCYKLNDC